MARVGVPVGGTFAKQKAFMVSYTSASVAGPFPNCIGLFAQCMMVASLYVRMRIVHDYHMIIQDSGGLYNP